MDRGARWATVHRVAKSRTRLSDFTITIEGFKRVAQVALVVKSLPANAGDVRDPGWSSGEGQGNPLQYFLPEESHGQRSLEGYSP